MAKPKRTGSMLDYLIRPGPSGTSKKKKADSIVVSIDPEEEEADTREDENNNTDHDSSTEGLPALITVNQVGVSNTFSIVSLHCVL